MSAVFPLPPLANLSGIPSPALLIVWERVEENIRRMLAIAGCPSKLRPHVKTHKLPQIVSFLVGQGVNKVKCATIAEAEMSATAGATDVLLAGHPTGPAIGRFLALQAGFPGVRFSTLADDREVLQSINDAAVKAGQVVEILIDLDVGQQRTGIVPGEAAGFADFMMTLPGIRPGGLHAYDGHLHQKDAAERAAACEAAYAPVEKLRMELIEKEVPVPRLVVGGTPCFPMHARRDEVECSPGTCVLWDAGYGTNLPDLDFLPAAVLLTRVISRPGKNRLCLDLGHKAVASEMSHPRVIFPDLPEAKTVMHSEEHLVLETLRAAEVAAGTALLGIPWHVCPTVALHGTVYVIKNNQPDGEWPVTARARRLTY